MIILGIETSCDDTAVAIIEATGENTRVLSNIVSSQTELHSEWGGVVPNLAAREHSKNIIPVLETALKEARISPQEVDLLSVTSGPGLIPALLVGTNFAKTLSYLWQKPLLPIHHIEGHIYSNFTEILNSDKKTISRQPIKFPLLALVVSGGHTQLILMKGHLQYEIIGETRDDAVGEAFDKVARILELGYPGGPQISKQAEKYQSSQKESSLQITFPRPMLNSAEFDFSFSGLKTAVLYETKKLRKKLTPKEFKELIPQICFEFQEACIDVLSQKTIRAIRKYQPQTVVLAGGVSANQRLRQELKRKIANEFAENGANEIAYFRPQMQYTADNATMIAIAGYFRWQKMSEPERKNAEQNWKSLQADAQMKMSEQTKV